MFYKEILNDSQSQLLPLLQEFKGEFYLCGGTAIALQLGHRRSIDFDLFTISKLNHKKILDKFNLHNLNPIVTRRVEEQLNLVVDGVKFTFLEYPFKILANLDFDNFIKMPSLLELASMKSYALGRRAKWKDYVDLYYILNFHIKLSDVIDKSREIFENLFSEKQFRAHLAYFDDVDYSEEVEYISNEPEDIEVKNTLRNIALRV